MEWEKAGKFSGNYFTVQTISLDSGMILGKKLRVIVFISSTILNFSNAGKLHKCKRWSGISQVSSWTVSIQTVYFSFSSSSMFKLLLVICSLEISTFGVCLCMRIRIGIECSVAFGSTFNSSRNQFLLVSLVTMEAKWLRLRTENRIINIYGKSAHCVLSGVSWQWNVEE